MRVTFTPPTESEFKQLFSLQPMRKGGGFDDISVFQSPLGYRKGGGIFSLISGVAKRIIPFLIRSAKPAAKAFGTAVATDLITKKRPLKQSVKKHGVTALKKTGLRLLKGSGKKRTKKRRTVSKKRTCKKRKYKSDVYDLL